jgi:uncharacterized RDD family membrane protein YckC
MPFCIRCGVSNTGTARFCAACGQPLPPARTPVAPPAPATVAQPDPAPVAPPDLPTPPVPPAQAAPAPPGTAVAGMGDRVLAVVLDAVLGAAVFAVTGMAIALRRGGATESGFSLQGTPALMTMGITALVGLLYYWLGEGLFGATLGKGIVGIAVERKGGGPCGLMASLIRNLFRLVDGIAVYLVGFLVAVLSASRQRIGDHVARTIVVRKSLARNRRGVLAAVWLGAILAGACGAFLLHRGAPETAAREVAATPTRAPLASNGDLKVVSFAFLEREDGPQRASALYKRGDTVHIKYEVGGLTTGPEGTIDLALQVLVRDPNGLAVHPLWEKELKQRIAGGQPVNGSLNAGLVSYAPAGTYTIQIRAWDKLQNRQVEYSPTFEVGGPPIQPASALEFRDFGVSLTEDGPAIEPPVLKRGGAIYMRWRVFGARAQDDRVKLRVGLKVLGPGGATVLDAPEYVTVDYTYPYRPPSFFVGMSGHVSVPAGFPKGAYTGRYLVTDYTTNTQVEHTAKLFEVR